MDRTKGQEENPPNVRRRGSITNYRGRKRARIYWNGKHHHVGMFDTEEDAQRAIDADLAVSERNAPGGSPTLETFGADWLDRRELSDGIRHVQKERSTWNRHILSSDLANIPLDELRTLDVHDWTRRCLRKKATHFDGHKTVPTSKPIDRKTVRNALSLLKRCLDDAVLRALVATNVARAVVLPRPTRVEDDVWTFLTEQEIDLLLQCDAVPLKWRLVYTVAIFTGLRRGELVALQWQDIDLRAGGLITVRRSMSAGVTKNTKKRHVPLFDAAFTALNTWRDLYRDQTELNVKSDGLVFPKKGGGLRRADDDFYWSDHNGPAKRLKNGGRELVRRDGFKTVAGILRPVRFHDLRHTFGSHLVMGSWGRVWSLQEVRDVMGHSSITVTEKYAHLSSTGIRAAAKETASRPGIHHLKLVKS